MWDYVDKRVKFVSHFNLWTKFKSIRYIVKEQNFVKFCSYTIESCLLWHIFPSFLLYLEKHMACFRASSNVALEWYITFLTKQWCKALKGGTISLKKRGPRRLPPYPSLISILEIAICLVGKAHVTKMKLNFNFFPLGLQIPQRSYCIFKKPVICTNLITCSAKHLPAAERGQ